VNRRELIAALGATAVPSLPIIAHAQRPRIPVIGYLSSVSKDGEGRLREAFWQGLGDAGFSENRNVTVIYLYADGQYERLPALAEELAARQVDVIVTGRSSPAALAAKRATSTIPIVFFLGADPIALGLVASYNRPGANVTGINLAPESLTAKRLELLNDLAPGSSPIAELVNPANKTVETEKRVASEAARTLGRELLFLDASSAVEIGLAFEETKRRQVAGLVVWFEALFQSNSDQIVALANRYRLATVFPTRIYTDIGGLLSYGPNLPAAYRQFGAYAGEILKGARPSDLPVMTPATFDLVINLKTARSLGITIPPTLLARADEIIE